MDPSPTMSDRPDASHEGATVVRAKDELRDALAPERAAVRLTATQQWLIANNKAITATVLLLLGVMLVASGVQGLVGY